MKIIERDDAKKNEEEEAKAYLLSLKSNRKFQKHFVQELVLPMLKKLSDLKFIYEDASFLSADDAEISRVIRQNRNTHTALKNIIAPILTEEDRKTL